MAFAHEHQFLLSSLININVFQPLMCLTTINKMCVFFVCLITCKTCSLLLMDSSTDLTNKTVYVVYGQFRFFAAFCVISSVSLIMFLVLPTDPNMVAHPCRHAAHHTVPHLCNTVSLTPKWKHLRAFTEAVISLVTAGQVITTRHMLVNFRQ